MRRVLELHEFFNAPENKVAIQFPSPETQYAWQNMSQFYPTAHILRKGPIAELAINLDPSVEDVSFEKGGKTESVREHLDNYPVDAFMAVRNGQIIFER